MNTIKRAIIFANGEMPDPDAVRSWLRPDDWIVAADGGTSHALLCGCTPHLIIGDMDSFPTGRQAELEEQGAQFLNFPADKDETDLELALLHAASNGATTILIVGALGGRLDQLLANVQLLARPELANLDVRIVTGNEMAWLVRDKTSIHGAIGDRVSLIPLGGDVQGVSTHGLRWPLENARLLFGQARGVSNVMTGPRAEIQLEAGLLLCIHATDQG